MKTTTTNTEMCRRSRLKLALDKLHQMPHNEIRENLIGDFERLISNIANQKTRKKKNQPG